MCGLIGFISYNTTLNRNKLYNEKRAFITQGLYMSALRGTDGTGVASVYNPSVPAEVYKRAVCSRDFLELRETSRVLVSVDSALAVMGHTRSFTKGYVDDESTHPFQYGHITLMHNGTVDNYKSLTKNCDVDMDSAHITCAMSETKDEKELLEKLYGAFTLVWHNSKTKTFNFARNEERPLYWIEVPEWEGIVYGSEMEILGAILGRNNIKTEGGWKYPPINTIFRINLDAKKLEMDTAPFTAAYGRGTRGHPTTTYMGTTHGTSKQKNGAQGTHTTSLMTKPELDLKYQDRAGNKNFRIRNSGRPSSAKGKKKAEISLAKLGLKYDGAYGADVMMFQPYKNNKVLGAVILTLMGRANQAVRCEAHNISKNTYDLLLEDGTVLGAVVNVRNYPTDKIPTVILEIDEDYLKLVSPPSKSSESEPNGRLRGPRGHLYSPAAFKELTAEGCAACNGNCNPKFADKMLWAGARGEQPICHECAGDDTTLRSMGLIT